MIIFWTNFGGGQGQRGFELLPLLIFLIPILFQALFGGIGGSITYVYDSQYGGWRRIEQQPSRTPQQQQWSLYSFFLDLLPFIIFILSVAIGIFSVRQAARRNNANGGNNNRRLRRTHSERLDATSRVIQRLPIEIHHSVEELEAMSVSELKTLLKKSSATTSGKNKQKDEPILLEKRDLIEAIVGNLNSSAESCSICVEDYQSGDVLRVLPCGHRYHLTCVDQWFLGAALDYSRPAACPICNTELPETIGEENNKPPPDSS